MNGDLRELSSQACRSGAAATGFVLSADSPGRVWDDKTLTGAATFACDALEVWACDKIEHQP